MIKEKINSTLNKMQKGYKNKKHFLYVPIGLFLLFFFILYIITMFYIARTNILLIIYLIYMICSLILVIFGVSKVNEKVRFIGFLLLFIPALVALLWMLFTHPFNIEGTIGIIVLYLLFFSILYSIYPSKQNASAERKQE